MYFLRKLRFFGVNSKILLLLYKAILEIVVRYGIHEWYGNLSAQILNLVKSDRSLSESIKRWFLQADEGDTPHVCRCKHALKPAPSARTNRDVCLNMHLKKNNLGLVVALKSLAIEALSVRKCTQVKVRICPHLL